MKKIILILIIVTSITTILLLSSRNLSMFKGEYTIIFESDRLCEHGLFSVDKAGVKFLREGGMPVTSLSGQKIAYVTYEFNKTIREYKTGLAILDRESGEVRYIDMRELQLSVVASPKLSPDLKYIAFVAQGECDNIFIKNLMTGIVEQITNYTPQNKLFIQCIDWTAFGNGIVYKNSREGLIYLDLQSKQTNLLINSKQFSLSDFSVAKNSDNIVFSGKGTITNKTAQYRQSELFMFNMKTKEIHQLTHNKFDERYPVYDPSGKWICYTSFRHHSPLVGGELYIMELDTKREYRITKAERKGRMSPFSGLTSDTYPCWVK